MGFLVLNTTFEFYLSRRQRLKLEDLSIPKETKMFEHIWKIDPTEYETNKRYGSDKMRVGGYKNLAALALEVPFYYFGGFAWLWGFAGRLAEPVSSWFLLRLLVFSLVKQLFEVLVFTPFSYYLQFVVEEKYKFNKMTLGTFVADTVKTFLLELVFSALVFWGLVWIVEVGGQQMPLYAGTFISVFIVLMMLIYPNFIAPLFNKFEILGANKEEKELDLKRKVEDIAQKAQFPVTEIYKVDGSKRSAHSQAYFFGIFKKKRIVIYDTLIEQLENHQTEAVLCHEIGHWYHSHNVQMLAFSLTVVQLMVWVMSYFIYDPTFYQSFGVAQPDYFIGVSLSMLMFGPISNVINILLVRLSRKNEFQADKFALKYNHGENLIWALVKIYKENKADLDPDPLFSALKHTHPTLIQRVTNIQALLKK